MCGKYIFDDGDSEQIADMINLAQNTFAPDVYRSLSFGDVSPGQRTLGAFFNRQRGAVRLGIMQWGISGRYKRLVINARSETAHAASFFRNCLHCAMPASGYYEWDADKTRYLFSTNDDCIFMAGLWRMENGMPRFVVMTMDAQGENALIHPRQPVLLTYENAKTWCMQNTTFNDIPRFFTKA